MALDLLTNAIIGLILGGAAGALGAYLGWSSGTEPFIARKFVTGIITGVIAGILVGFANVAAFKSVADDITLLVIYGDIFGAALAATLGAPKVSGAITTRLQGDTTTTTTTTVK